MSVPARLAAAAPDRGVAAGVLARAPARVNIIGEHTDYNDGLVLPTTTALYTWVRATAREDRRLVARTHDLDAEATFSLDEIVPGDEPDWADYIKGVLAQIELLGIRLPGAELAIESDIPLGAGLSSSAALELAVAHAMLGLAGRQLPPARLASLCQRAEHEFARVRCGIMDQYTIACASEAHAILLDCRTLAAHQVPVPPSIGMLLTDSGVRHRLPDGEYNNRADECAAALKVLQGLDPGLRSLRDLDAATLERGSQQLGEVLHRRCRHLLSENRRVELARQALEKGAGDELGELLTRCHESLRDDFEISCTEVDDVVAIANACSAVHGSRMIGGGFGGCILSIVDRRHAGTAAKQIRAGCEAAFGRSPWMHRVCPASPAQTVTETCSQP